MGEGCSESEGVEMGSDVKYIPKKLLSTSFLPPSEFHLEVVIKSPNEKYVSRISGTCCQIVHQKTTISESSSAFNLAPKERSQWQKECVGRWACVHSQNFA